MLAACEDGFLYVYDFDEAKGGDCKLIHVHDLRSALDGITGKLPYDSMGYRKLP